ncbi:hypothetical protein SAMN05216194_102345 [Stutzerimonas kunmingensis]|nr:hypothetical protein SAMN05216194_102345 [Stutzerimonas kunmingensis]
MMACGRVVLAFDRREGWTYLSLPTKHEMALH